MSSGLAAVVTYAVLTALWGAILALYVRQRRHARSDPLIALLLTVLALDAAKSVIESVYFGLLWAANYGVFPEGLKALGDPAALTAVKVLNVVVATIVLFRLARFWVPSELGERTRLQKELETNLEALRESEEMLRLAVRASSDFVWDADLRTGRIGGSEGAGAWLGYRPEEWPPTPWHVIVHPDDLERVRAGIRDAISGRTRSYDTRHRVKKKDGTVLHVHATGVATRDPNTGRATRFVGTLRDVTREVQEEALRVQTQKLESLGLLAGGIAHDFNNLLTVISSSVETALYEDGGPSSRDALQTARMAVARARTLTRQLLAYAGRGSLTSQPVDLNELVGSMAELLSITVSRKVKLVSELGERLPAVDGDVAQLQQVVMNLVTNAAEAIGDRDGTVRIKTELVVLEAPPPARTGSLTGRALKLSVQDTGAGMTPDVLTRIFDPFFTTKGAGRGLGLSALAGIITAHGGAIDVQSRVGEGTTFTVYLPALATAATPASNEPAAERRKLELKVLIVDDEPMLRRSARRVLDVLGCSSDEAETGRKAVELVRADPHKWNVVLMDQTMPELSGSEAAEQLLAINPALPIILSSGYSANGLPTDARFMTLSKPYTLDELEKALRKATQRP